MERLPSPDVFTSGDVTKNEKLALPEMKIKPSPPHVGGNRYKKSF
jgi:hypothetical protein